jgi:hypothetical protein
VDIHVMDEAGAPLAITTAAPDRGGLAVLAERIDGFGGPVYAAIESMNGARFVHDQLELAGWQVEIADAQKVKGWPRWPARPTRSTPGYWPSSPAATWSRPSGCPPRRCAPNGNKPAGGCTWSGTAPR